ncbi:DUF4190 domain-containing protein [Kribbella sp. HUAS MG21]|uniref:DUF4190 domain-containing protein n=1 Tax=Kribbella sp. HUAS MG21 TaxID=3160966 RepID=A0AAU7TIJ0_9ACTN
MTQPPYGPGPDQPPGRPQDLPNERPQDRPRDPTQPFPTYGRPTEPHAQQTGSAGGAAGSYGAAGAAGSAGASWAAPGQPPYAQTQYGAPYGGQAQYGQSQAGHAAYGQGFAPGQYPAQYGQPPAAYGYGYGYPGQGGTNGLATAALVCGLGGFVIGISAPVAIGLGIAALVQINRRQQAGKGMAIAGLVIGSLVTLGYILIFGLVIAFGSSADDEYGASDPSGTSSTYVDELAVGECFNDTKTEDEVVRQPCPTEHDGEIVAIVTLPAGEYPGNNGIDKAADRACRPEFGTYVGKSSDESELYLSWWTPDKSAWDHGDRRILCAAYGPDDKITGTVKNSRR